MLMGVNHLDCLKRQIGSTTYNGFNCLRWPRWLRCLESIALQIDLTPSTRLTYLMFRKVLFQKFKSVEVFNCLRCLRGWRNLICFCMHEPMNTLNCVQRDLMQQDVDHWFEDAQTLSKKFSCVKCLNMFEGLKWL